MRELLMQIYKSMCARRSFEELSEAPLTLWSEAEAIPAVAQTLIEEGDAVAGARCPESFLLTCEAAAETAAAALKAGGEVLSAEFSMLGANAPIKRMVGAALSLKLGGVGAMLAYLDGGAAWDGDFAEALRLIALWQLPIILACRPSEPNAERPWEIADLTQACEQLGIEHAFVDASDVMKLMPALRCAFERAREGDGATLIECSFAPEDAEKPAERLRAMLLSEGFASADECDRLEAEAREDMLRAWRGGER